MSLPADLESVITAWLGASIKAGAAVAWFAFEGSFDFGHILTADVASQVYAVGDERGYELALDADVRHSRGWARELASRAVGIAGPPMGEDA